MIAPSLQHGCWFALLAMSMNLSGCTQLNRPSLPVIGDHGAKLEMTSQFFPGAGLEGAFDACLYGYDSDNNFTLVMFSGPMDDPAQAVTLRMFWLPQAARTPIARDATNVMLRYVVFRESPAGSNEVGVYTGAGFGYLKNAPGSEKIGLGIWQATLRLADRSAAFDDTLGEARLEGEVIALRDDEAVTAALHRLNVLVTQRLGYPRFVDGESLDQIASLGR